MTTRISSYKQSYLRSIHWTQSPVSGFGTRWFARVLGVALLLGLALLTSSCSKTVASYYRKCMRPTSYYRTSYCFELPKEQVRLAVLSVLRRYHFPKIQETQTHGKFLTEPVSMPHYSCNAKWAYTVGLEIQIQEFRGRISLQSFPTWVFQKTLPALPPAPERHQFPTFDAYDQAYQAYFKQITERSEMVQRYVSLMKQWQGCDVRHGSLRTLVSIQAKVTGYPQDGMGNIQTQQPKVIHSDKTMEYATLREIGRSLNKAQFMPRILP